LTEENLSEENYFVVCEENFFSKSDTRLWNNLSGQKDVKRHYSTWRL